MDNENKDKVCILIVDDVEANRFILRNIIVEMGYQPILAENGVQALKIFPKCRPQLILLDISMPEMDGFEFCKIMKSNADSRDVPIIFISAFDDESDIEKGFSLGGEDYVTRPFIPEEIKARVGVRLKLYDANQKLIESNRKLQMVVNEQLKQIEQEKKTVLYALANVARENSFYDEKHLERLQYNCKILGQAMQLSRLYEHIVSDTYIEALELSAPLCDVGNVAVPMEILKKKSHLTEGEMNIMKTHTTVGAKILQDISATGDYNDFIKVAVDVARYHHENWDGSGYPNGVSGDDIPLSAQIVALVSTYCALTERRTYREPYSREESLEIMQADAGSKFNEDIFQIFKKISRQLH